MINGDIVKPEIPYAVFNDDLNPAEMKKIIANLNYGNDMLLIFKQYRDNLHIMNVIEMITRMEEVFRKYDYEMFEIRKEDKP
jgi:hypothetical protein